MPGTDFLLAVLREETPFSASLSCAGFAKAVLHLSLMHQGEALQGKGDVTGLRERYTYRKVEGKEAGVDLKKGITVVEVIMAIVKLPKTEA